MNFINFNVG